jgi:predicted dehydrogenase
MNTKYSIAIIGAGLISSEFDNPGQEKFLTHCHSICDNVNLNPIGIFDINSKKVNNASEKWNIKPFFNLEALLNENPDIILIAVPDEFHFEYLNKVIEYKPKIVVCEKPLTNSLSLSKKILKIYSEERIDLAVCYQRRYDEDFIKIKKDYLDNSLGNFLSGSVVYSKGIMHNGSHAVDILRFIFGEVDGIKSFSERCDYNENDPTVSAIISFDDGNIHLISGDERFHSLFEIDLIFETKRFRITDSGNYIEIFEVGSDPVYDGYSSLNKKESRVSTLPFALKNMWSSVVKHLFGKEKLSTLAEDSLKTQDVCDKIKNHINL